MDPVGAVAALVGARVRRVELVGHHLLAMDLDAGCTLVVGATRAARGIGILGRRLGGDAQSAFVRKLRAHLEGGAELARVHFEGAALILSFAGSTENVRLACVLDGAEGDFVLLDDAGQVLHATATRTFETGTPFVAPRARTSLVLPQSLAELEAAGEALVRARARADFDARTAALRRALGRGLARADRRLVAITRDLAKSAEAPTLRMHGSLLLAHAHEVTADASEFELVDETSEPPKRHLVALTRAHRGVTGPRAAM